MYLIAAWCAVLLFNFNFLLPQMNQRTTQKICLMSSIDDVMLSQTCPQATSWYNLSSLLAIDHRTTSFLGCFHLHVKKNKQPCLVVINYSKYLQYFEGQINKVFRPCVLDCWLHSGSKKVQWKHFLLFTDVFCGQLLKKPSMYLPLWVFDEFLEKEYV